MYQNKMDITDLLADESFINYCKSSSPQDVAFWENYILQNPQQKEIIEIARSRYFQLFNVLAEADREEQAQRLRNRIEQKEIAPVISIDAWKEKKSNKKMPQWLKLAAVAAVLLPIVFFTIRYFNPTTNSTAQTFATAFGERKSILLPDSSMVNLNAGSEITIDGQFGKSHRNIYLKGEAFFDVKHDGDLPFIVHTPAMNIKALGTAFDVKAYGNENITETSLIRGLIEVTLKENNNQVVVLHPNHKIAWEHSNATAEEIKTNAPADVVIPKKKEEGVPERIKATNAGQIKEIAWKENKLIFENDTFSDIVVLLERWYGTRIDFKDDAVRNYRFTGMYEKEDLRTVLGFMQESKHFNFTIEEGETRIVYLSK